MIEKPDPWRVPIAVAQIPDTGLHRDLEADQPTRLAVADVGSLREVLSVVASFDVTPKSGGRFHVEGHVRARVGQTCVVTLMRIRPTRRSRSKTALSISAGSPPTRCISGWIHIRARGTRYLNPWLKPPILKITHLQR